MPPTSFFFTVSEWVSVDFRRDTPSERAFVDEMTAKVDDLLRRHACAGQAYR